MLGTQPIIQLLALYNAYIYGLMYLVLSTFPTLWQKVYCEKLGISGLNYLSLTLGYLLGSQICALSVDRIYKSLTQSNNGTGKPEYRIPLLTSSALLVPLGLFWYGWSAQDRLHWIMPNIGIALFACGVIIGVQCTVTYIIDAYSRYTASAIAAITLLRSLLALGFPLFAPRMYQVLGYGWGNSVLAFAAILLGWPATFAMWKWGEALRGKSQYASGIEE